MSSRSADISDDEPPFSEGDANESLPPPATPNKRSDLFMFADAVASGALASCPDRSGALLCLVGD